ncbi:MAG: glycosyltransferase family 1 protein [Actinobacteria bacterium]|nr:glycosyltransferase family 1 protein [Actinomycetota bacterium]
MRLVVRFDAPPTVKGVRVALVAETFTPAVNGVVNSVIRTAEQLSLHGYQPVVIAPSGESFRVRLGHEVPVVTVPAISVPGYAGLQVARPGLDLTPVLDELDPDVVHLASPAILGWAAVRAAVRTGRPAVASFQTDLAGFVRRRGIRFGAPGMVWTGLRRLHGQADVTLAPSTATAYLLGRHGISPVRVIPRGVDLSLFRPMRREPTLRAQLLAGRRLLVGYVGRLSVEKRVNLLRQVSERSDVSLVVVGEGPQRTQLEGQLPRAQFLGRCTGTELAAIMASLDLLIHPGADETFCQVVQEALASGVPVIAPASGGPLDLIAHRDNCWVWSDDDPRTLASMVDSLLDHPDEIRLAAARARPSVRHRTWSAVTEALIAVYDEVLDRPRRHRFAS